jgi:hypothetical protein
VNADLLAVGQGALRGTDGNSLLRMYDRLRGMIGRSLFQRERERAGRALERIAKELQKPHVSV